MRLPGSSLVAAPAQLKLELLENIVWLHPGSDHTSEVRDASVRGTVTLALARARPVSSITVTLAVLVDLSPHGNQLESFALWDDIKEVLPEAQRGQVLQAGTHEFPFVFGITPSAAVAERCNYGRISQRVQASGKGLGRAGSDITSDYRYLAFVANPQPDVGQMPDPLEMNLSGFHEAALGVWEMDAFSPCFAVASKFELRLRLMGAVVPLRMHSVTCVFRQTFSLQSPKTPAKPIVTKPLRVRVFRQCVPGEALFPNESTLDAPVHVPQGEQWEMSWSGRLPNSNKLRPSTHSKTVTPLAVKDTELVVELVFDTPTATRQVLTISSPVFLASCMCRSAALMLPPYSKDDPHQDKKNQNGWNAPLGMISERKNECFCGVESHAVEEVTAGLRSAESSQQSSPHLPTIPLEKEGSDTNLTRYSSVP